MHVICADRDLPAKPGAGVNALILQCDRQQPNGHLFAGGDDGVIFTGIMHRPDVTRPGNKLPSGGLVPKPPRVRQLQVGDDRIDVLTLHRANRRNILLERQERL